MCSIFKTLYINPFYDKTDVLITLKHKACSKLADTLTAHVLRLIRLSFYGWTAVTSPGS